MSNIFIENQPNAIVPSQPNNPAVTQPLPVYIPTPKHILEARKANGTSTDNGVNDNGATGDVECSASKRPRLEYVPKAIKINHNPIPTYIPSALSRSTSIDGSGGSDGAANDLEYEPINIDDKTNQNGGDITGLLTDLSSDQITKNGQTTENGSLTPAAANESNVLNEMNVPSTIDESKSKENRHRSSSSSSSRHHRHHSSSNSSSNHKSSHSDRKGSSSSSRSSGSSHRSSRHHHHSSSRKSKHSDKDKDKDDVKLKTDSKPSDGKSSGSENHRSLKRSSSSSSSSRHHHRSSNHSSKTTHSSNNHSSSSNKKEAQDCPSNSVAYDMDSECDDDDDDDVEAQCRMIFEEFEPQTANETQSDEMLSVELQSMASSNHDIDIDDATITNHDDATKKKRIAHDNADKQVKPIATFKRNSDHVRNAMQVMYEFEHQFNTINTKSLMLTFGNMEKMCTLVGFPAARDHPEKGSTRA